MVRDNHNSSEIHVLVTLRYNIESQFTDCLTILFRNTKFLKIALFKVIVNISRHDEIIRHLDNIVKGEGTPDRIHWLRIDCVRNGLFVAQNNI